MASLSSNKVDIITMGCRLNSLESDLIAKQLQKTSGNVAIINTCAITSEAVRQSQQQIRKIAKLDSNKKIIVTGCAVQSDNKKFKNMPEVSAIIGNKEKTDKNTIGNIIKKLDKKTKKEKILHVSENLDQESKGIIPYDISTIISDKTRGLVQIQQGCNHFCTFCIVPYTRGKSISFETNRIVDKTAQLVENGYKEVILTGVDLTSWGQDFSNKQKLGNLVEQILIQVPNLFRLRLSSLDPACIDDILLNCYKKYDNLANYAHLSMQSGCDLILKRMKRRHREQNLFKVCEQLRNATKDRINKIGIGADIIAGFPTETEEMHNTTLQTLKQLELSFLHVFPYSVRNKTPASKMPQLPIYIKKNRAKQIREQSYELTRKFLNSQIGKKESIILENNNKGYTSNYSLVKLINADNNLKTGSIVNVNITNLDIKSNTLEGEI